MGNHPDQLVLPQVWDDDVIPVGQLPLDDIFEAFRARDRVKKVRVPGVACLTALVPQRRGRSVVRTASEHELLVAELVTHLNPVLPLQRTVVSFVEPPRTAYRNPVPIRDVEGDLGGPDSATKQGSVHYLRKQVVLDEEIARAASLEFAGGVRSTLAQPANRFSLFHSLSP
jgi:hypothetical protein